MFPRLDTTHSGRPGRKSRLRYWEGPETLPSSAGLQHLHPSTGVGRYTRGGQCLARGTCTDGGCHRHVDGSGSFDHPDSETDLWVLPVRVQEFGYKRPLIPPIGFPGLGGADPRGSGRRWRLQGRDPFSSTPPASDSHEVHTPRLSQFGWTVQLVLDPIRASKDMGWGRPTLTGIMAGTPVGPRYLSPRSRDGRGLLTGPVTRCGSG